MILIRTHRFGDAERALAEMVEASGQAVAIACDETRAELDTGRFPKVSITRQACRRLGLYTPPDFTWRNGDYAFYLARQKFSQARYFWMVEPDVEHSFADFGHLLAHFDSMPNADLLAGYLRPADADWWWRPTMRGGTTGVYRCFFPLIRMSAKAIDVCLKQRQRSRFSLRDRLHWPNDEVFVATTTVNAGLMAVDLNAVSGCVYEESTFRYDPLNGDDGAFPRPENRVFHPVLRGDAYLAKLAQRGAVRDTRIKRMRLRMQRAL